MPGPTSAYNLAAVALAFSATLCMTALLQRTPTQAFSAPAPPSLAASKVIRMSGATRLPHAGNPVMHQSSAAHSSMGSPSASNVAAAQFVAVASAGPSPTVAVLAVAAFLGGVWALLSGWTQRRVPDYAAEPIYVRIQPDGLNGQNDVVSLYSVTSRRALSPLYATSGADPQPEEEQSPVPPIEVPSTQPTEVPTQTSSEVPDEKPVEVPKTETSAEAAGPSSTETSGKSVKGKPRRKPAGNPKISAKNFVLSDKARAKKVSDVAKYIAEMKAKATPEDLANMEKGGRVRLVLNSSMVVLAESARNIVNLKTEPQQDWTLEESLRFVLSDEAESLRDLMALEASYAVDLLARQAGRKMVDRVRNALSGLPSLPALPALPPLRLPFLVPTTEGGTSLVLEEPAVMLDTFVPVLNPDEAAHAGALELLVREVFGDRIAAVVAGEKLTLDDAQTLLRALAAGSGDNWYTSIRESWVQEVDSLQAVRALTDAERRQVAEFVRTVLDKVWARVLKRAAALQGSVVASPGAATPAQA